MTTSTDSKVICHRVDGTTLIAFHTLLNQPQTVSFETPSEADAFVDAVTNGPVETGIASLDAITLMSDAEARDVLAARATEYLGRLRERISFLSLMTAGSCNLGCSYCIAAANMDSARASRALMMPLSTAKRAIDWYYSLPTVARERFVNFSGGEPLLNRRVVTDAVAYIREQHDTSTRITINTNAVLADGSLANFFAANRVAIATSLDGIPSVSDRVRVTRSGLPASASILRAWDRLLDAGCELTGFMATFNDSNIVHLDTDIVDFAKERGFKWVRIACDVIHLLAHPVDDMVERIWRIYEHGVTEGVIVEGFWSTALHNMIYRDRLPDSVPFFCGAVSGETISIHPNGRISACGFSSGDFGNILSANGFNYAKHAKFVAEYYPGARDFCRGCAIEGSCAGGCNITRETAVGIGSDAAIEYNCELYRALTRKLLVHELAVGSGPSQGAPTRHAF